MSEVGDILPSVMGAVGWGLACHGQDEGRGYTGVSLFL